jgi:MoxR-like ATPase
MNEETMEMAQNPPAHGDFAEIRESVEALRTHIGRIIVGQDQMVELLMVALLARGHVLIEGYPGLAKTLTAKLLAKSIAANFSRIQFTPDLMPSDLLGTHVFNMQNSTFSFRKGPLFSNLILIDEINRAPAKTQSALFEVMEERHVTQEGVQFNMEEPFLIVATQNPVDLEGTYPLPEAQMDRFLFKINITYPTLDQETQILQRHLSVRNMHEFTDIQTVITGAALKRYQERLPAVHVEEQILRFIADLVHRTRVHRDILIGGSPRASLALLYGSRALAMIRGRDFVIPEDVKDIAIPALTHRLVLTVEKEMEGGKVNDVIGQLLSQTEVPR